MKRTLALLAASLSFHGACSRHNDGPGNTTTRPTDPGKIEQVLQLPKGALAFGLTEVADCTAAEAYLEARAIKNANSGLLEMRERLLAGQPIEQVYPPMARDTASAPTAEADNAAQGSASAPDAYTDTNNQVAGVQEADFVKTNGTHIFKLSGTRLHVVKSWPANDLKVIATLDLAVQTTQTSGVERFPWVMGMVMPQDLLLERDSKRLIILSHDSVSLKSACDDEKCSYGEAGTRITLVDVANPAIPKILSESVIPGWYHTARMVGKSVRVVMNSWTPWVEGVETWPRSYFGGAVVVSDGATATSESPVANLTAAPNRNVLLAEIDQMLARNEQLIRAKTMDFWLPNGQAWSGSEKRVLERASCENIFRPNHLADWGVTNLATLDTATGSVHTATLLASTWHHYSSQSALYLSTTLWSWDNRSGSSQETFIHKFDITEPESVAYEGSGTVSGYPLNQFSFDEHKGHLRVAHTQTNWTADRATRNENRISVLSFADGVGRVVGRTEAFDPNMRIQAVRFLGDRGFVVTFENFDPLRTVDLSDPTTPRMVGKLELPGFSTYLQPIGENLLLAVGFHIPTAENMWDRRLKISLFDVSDFANPSEVDKSVFSSTEYSEASWDHKAITWFAERSLGAIPLSNWSSGHGRSQLKVFAVDLAARRLAIKGSMTMADVTAQESFCGSQWTRETQIRRSIFADGFVYAIGDLGIASASAATPATRLSLVTTPVGSAFESRCWMPMMAE